MVDRPGSSDGDGQEPMIIDVIYVLESWKGLWNGPATSPLADNNAYRCIFRLYLNSSYGHTSSICNAVVINEQPRRTYLVTRLISFMTCPQCCLYSLL